MLQTVADKGRVTGVDQPLMPQSVRLATPLAFPPGTGTGTGNNTTHPIITYQYILGLATLSFPTWCSS